jgi:hypothetical protein
MKHQGGGKPSPYALPANVAGFHPDASACVNSTNLKSIAAGLCHNTRRLDALRTVGHGGRAKAPGGVKEMLQEENNSRQVAKTQRLARQNKYFPFAFLRVIAPWREIVYFFTTVPARA